MRKIPRIKETPIQPSGKGLTEFEQEQINQARAALRAAQNRDPETVPVGDGDRVHGYHHHPEQEVDDA